MGGRRWLAVALAATGTAVSLGFGLDRAARRLVDAPRRRPEEDELAGALERLGGEAVRFPARDGLGLSARWLPAAAPDATRASAGAPALARVAPGPVAGGDGEVGDGDLAEGVWRPDPEEAILLLHGWSGSVAPDLVEYGPFLRRTAGVLGLDFRGHGDSDPAPTTFGLREVEDVAGALTWLGGRGVRRVCLFGTSMGGMTAIAAAVLLRDGRLARGEGAEEWRTAGLGAEGPSICGVVAESVTPELRVVVARRLRLPAASLLAARIVAAASRRVGADLRSVEPLRTVGLLGDCPLFLIAGTADRTLPIAAARRLAAAASEGTTWWEVDRAEHAGAHRLVPDEYEARVTRFLRQALRVARSRS